MSTKPLERHTKAELIAMVTQQALAIAGLREQVSQLRNDAQLRTEQLRTEQLRTEPQPTTRRITLREAAANYAKAHHCVTRIVDGHIEASIRGNWERVS